MEKSIKNEKKSKSAIRNAKLYWQSKLTNISMNSKSSDIDKNQLKNWGLPEAIINYYGRKGITRFFDWQVECLQMPGVLEDGKNLVYSAPTSAGKTMVADILLFKTLLERRKKAIIILPFVSISVEKVQNLKQIFRRIGLRIDSFAGQTNPRGGLQRVDAAVCTIEKANNMINRLLEEKKINDIGLIIVDELHMIGDSSRGYILELLLSKLMLLRQSSDAINPLQIVGMSATIPNLTDIAKWLNAELYICDYRPVPLHEHIVVEDEILKVIDPSKIDSQVSTAETPPVLTNGDAEIDLVSVKKIDCDQLTFNTSISHSLIYMAIETLAQGYSALIFCPTRSLCESIAKSIAGHILSIGQKDRKPQNEYESYIRQQLHSDQILCYKRLVNLISTLKRSATGYDPNLERVIKFGCAFHHAGLTMEERGTIEQGFRDGTLRILCCTTTLSAGVNLPARRVLITSPLDYSNNMITVSNYRQMIGRAGRKGIDILGESYLFCSQKDLRIARRLLSSPMQPVKSNLVSIGKVGNNEWQPVINGQLLRAVLEVIANDMVNNIKDINGYFECTFFHNCPLNCWSSSQQQSSTTLNNAEEIIDQSINLTLKSLQNYQFIYIESSSDEKQLDDDCRIAITDLGRAVISSGINPNDGQFIYEELKRFRTQLSLLTDLHLVYQTTPVYVINQLPDIDWRHYLNLYERWDKNTRFIAKMIGISENFLCLQLSSSGLMRANGTQAQIHRRFYASLALFELIEEVPMQKVQDKYNLNKGTLQSLQQQASTFAGMLSSFCQRLRWKTLAKIFDEFQPRLSFGIQLDLIDLVRLPCINSMIARQLFNKGYEDISSLVNSNAKDIEMALMTSKDLVPTNNADPSETYVYIPSLDLTITIADLAIMIVKEARALMEKDIGLKLQIDQPDSGSTANSPVAQSEEPEQSKEQEQLAPQPIHERSHESIEPKNVKRIKTEDDVDKDSVINNNQSIPNCSTPNNAKKIDSTIKSNDTSIYFEDDDDLLEELSIILSKNDSKKNCVAESSMSFDADVDLLEMLEHRMPTTTNIAEPEMVRKDEQRNGDEEWSNDDDHNDNMSFNNSSGNDNSINADDDVDEFIQSLINGSNNDVPINPPMFYESNVSCDNFELITVENEQSSKGLLHQILANPAPTIGLYFHMEKTKIDSSKQRKKLIFKPGTSSFTIENDQDSQNLNGIRLKNSPNYYLSSLYMTQLNNTKIYRISSKEALEYLRDNWFRQMKELKTLKAIRFACYDVKRAIKCLREALDFEWNFLCYQIEWYDVTVATWLLNPESSLFNIDSLRIKDLPKFAADHLLDQQYFERINNYRQMLMNSQQFPQGLDSIREVDYVLKILILFNTLNGLLIRLRERNLYKSYRLIEIQSRICITVMESNPTMIDREYMNCLEDTIQNIMDRIENRIYQIVGRKFNLNSPDQVSNIVYSPEMNLISSYFNVQSANSPVSGKRKILPKTTPVTRKATTSKLFLMRLQESVGNKSKLPLMIMEWRRLNHALTNSLMTINRHWLRRNNDSLLYGHCCEWTATGRISMYDPNLINLDKDFEVKTHLNLDEIENKKSSMINIRRMIIAPSNYELLTADYCQLELRILAHFSRDTNLMNVLNNVDQDVFVSIAADWKCIERDKVSYELRQQAKQICYGIIYGIGDESLAHKLEITVEQASEYRASFFKRYNCLQQFIHDTIDNCREKCYVETIAGRRRMLPEIRSNRHQESSKACRQAINTKIQGSAADIIKIAMVAVQKQIDQQKLQVRFVLQMYDELMYQVPSNQIRRFASILRQQMELIGDCLRVILPVKIAHGPNWSEMVPLEL